MTPVLYEFYSKGYLTTVAVRPDLFKKALEEDEYGYNRDIHHNLTLGQYSHYSFPIIFHQYDGNRFRDVLDTRAVCTYLISDRMRDLLSSNDITGWRTYPIELYDKKDHLISGYNGFSITGRGGKFDKNYELGYFDKDRNHFGATTRGVYNLNNWDGSDFFIINPLWIIVTERVMKLLKKNRIDAIEYEKLSDYVDYIGESRF